MLDFFEVLHEPHRPWVDEEQLKKKFLDLSSKTHPDRVHSGSGAEKESAHQKYLLLNAAYACLRQPKDRLRHLIELERGTRPQDLQEIPPDSMDLFIQAGRLCKETDAFLDEKQHISSPLLKVRFFQRGMEWHDRLARLQKDLEIRRHILEEELRHMNRFWEAAPKPGDPGRVPSLPLRRLEEIYRELSFLLRWLTQIHERIVQLAM
jgi:curved DNA-binding protein CbpA